MSEHTDITRAKIKAALEAAEELDNFDKDLEVHTRMEVADLLKWFSGFAEAIVNYSKNPD